MASTPSRLVPTLQRTDSCPGPTEGERRVFAGLTVGDERCTMRVNQPHPAFKLVQVSEVLRGSCQHAQAPMLCNPPVALRPDASAAIIGSGANTTDSYARSPE